LRRAPTSVLSFAALIAGTLLLLLVTGGIRAEHAFPVAVLILLTLGLVRGFWPAWAFLIALGLASVVHALATGPKWWGTVVLNATMVVLLAAPSTRRYVRRGRPRFVGWP
jgi:hypothetical protein